jgi:hypothetical protein
MGEASSGWRARRTRTAWAVLCLAGLAANTGNAAGISGYLPLNLEPRLEHDVERLMVLADQPIMRRPIPLVAIEAAMPAACAVDEALCLQVQRELAPWMGRAALGMISFEAAIANAAQLTQPNERGAPADSHWQVAGQAYARVGEHAAFNIGAVAYPGRINPAGSFVSVGFSFAQLDFGFRDHWLSPLRDSAFLLSTEAPTILSATLSNSVPLTRARIQYEVFAGQLSHSDNIVVDRTTGQLTSGHPEVTGFSVSIEPVKGWSIGGARLMQFGGGRSYTLAQLLRVLIGSAGGEAVGTNSELGNQQVSISSSLVIPGPAPMTVYVEYAAEDTFHSQAYRFGNGALSAGIFLPKLRPDLQLRYEYSNWEDVWYTHHLYLDGLTNQRLVLGNWGADWRTFGDGVGGQSHMLQLDWQRPSGATYGARYRTVQNARYNDLRLPSDYHRAHLLQLTASAPWRTHELAAGLDLGRDMTGKNYGRLSLTLYMAGDTRNNYLDYTATAGAVAAVPRVERFVEVGMLAGRLQYEQDVYEVPSRVTDERALHYGIGVRRSVSQRSDFGARLEIDNLHGHNLYSIRALDYRLRLGKHFALTGFFGFSRYELTTPAHGYNLGGGVQWRDVMPRWDISLEARYFDRIVRKKDSPAEPIIVWPNEFYTMPGVGLSIARRF